MCTVFIFSAQIFNRTEILHTDTVIGISVSTLDQLIGAGHAWSACKGQMNPKSLRMCTIIVYMYNYDEGFNTGVEGEMLLPITCIPRAL